jgi:hypothetical protein
MTFFVPEVSQERESRGPQQRGQVEVEHWAVLVILPSGLRATCAVGAQVPWHSEEASLVEARAVEGAACQEVLQDSQAYPAGAPADAEATCRAEAVAQVLPASVPCAAASSAACA